MAKFALGFAVTVIACMWFWFYMNIFVLTGWQEKWYSFPLFFTEIASTFGLAFFVGSILEDTEKWLKK